MLTKLFLLAWCNKLIWRSHYIQLSQQIGNLPISLLLLWLQFFSIPITDPMNTSSSLAHMKTYAHLKLFHAFLLCAIVTRPLPLNHPYREPIWLVIVVLAAFYLLLSPPYSPLRSVIIFHSSNVSCPVQRISAIFLCTQRRLSNPLFSSFTKLYLTLYAQTLSTALNYITSVSAKSLLQVHN